MRNKLKAAFSNRYLLVLLLILTAVFWIWWIPGPRVANDFSYVSSDFLKLQFDIPRVWNERGAEGLGEYGVFLLWSYPVSLIFGVLANFGLTFEIWERILILLYIFLGSFSIWKFLTKFNLSDKAKLIGALFYLVNTYSILLIDGGQISIALAFALFPLVFLIFSEAVHSDLSKKILAGLLVAMLGFFDIRFTYILFLLLLVRLFFDISEQSKKRMIMNLKDWITTGGTVALLVLGLNAYWLVAQIKNPIEESVFDSFTKISANFVNIGHSFLVISPHWHTNVFGQISRLRAEFILLPILAFAVMLFRRKDKTVLFWLLVSLFSIFLAKGGSAPLHSLYSWFHADIPGFSLFRDSTKFFVLVILSYSVLISMTSEEIFKRASNRIILTNLYTLFIVGYFLFLIRPVLTNQMTGTFSIQPFEKEFESLSNVLKNDHNFGRVFWIPVTAPLSYSNLNHPIVEAARVFNRTPFVFEVRGTYEIFNFLREASYMGEIFDVAAVSYLAYPFPDTSRENLSSDEINYYYTFFNQLANLPWIEKTIEKSEVPVLKVKNHQDKIFIAKNSWIVFGTDEIFTEATKSANLRFSDNAIIFAEQKVGLGPIFYQYPEAKIVLQNKTITDLLATFIPEDKIIFPARQVKMSPDATGWWKNDGTNLISWRDFLQTKHGIDSKEFDLGEGWAVGEGDLKFQISNFKFQKNNVLLARIMESSRSGTLRFYQDEQLIGEVSTRIDGNSNVRWFEIGLLPEASDLIIKAKGDINVINALAVVSPQDLVDYKGKTDILTGRITSFEPEKVGDKTASVVYQRINQTKYKIKVSNLTSPEMLVFSATFHPGWRLNGQSSIQVYGFLNGFRVEKNGAYILEFEPQKYVYPGLVVSALTILTSSYLLLRKRMKV